MYLKFQRQLSCRNIISPIHLRLSQNNNFLKVTKRHVCDSKNIVTINEVTITNNKNDFWARNEIFLYGTPYIQNVRPPHPLSPQNSTSHKKNGKYKSRSPWTDNPGEIIHSSLAKKCISVFNKCVRPTNKPACFPETMHRKKTVNIWMFLPVDHCLLFYASIKRHRVQKRVIWQAWYELYVCSILKSSNLRGTRVMSEIPEKSCCFFKNCVLKEHMTTVGPRAQIRQV
jgi:hypothetical protein